jgi:hypothetical protein
VSKVILSSCSQSLLFTIVFSSHAPTDFFSLLCWCCGLYTVVIHYPSISSSSPPWTSLTAIMTTLLDLLLQPSTRAKPSVRKSAVVRTRRALRSVNMTFVFLGQALIFFQSPTHLPYVMNALLAQSKTFSSPLVAIPLLGIAVDVTTHLKSAKDVNSISVSAESKVIEGRTYWASFDGLPDRDPHIVLQHSADVSNTCSLAHYGSIHTIISPPLTIFNASLDGPHRVHQNRH